MTADIEGLFAAARSEGDPLGEQFMQWFLTEQVEEEKTVGQIVESLRLAADSGPALLLLDRELGARSHAPDGAAAAA